MKPVSLLTKECKTVSYVSGPLIFVQSVKGVSFGEIAHITLPSGEGRTGQVLDVSRDLAVVQVYEGTSGIDNKETRIQFTGKPPTVDVSLDMLGRTLNGVGKPRDGGPDVIQEASLDINGMPINPYARDKPADFIQTGMSLMH
jgi:V/A-type H+-transporting ATPase subunit B